MRIILYTCSVEYQCVAKYWQQHSGGHTAQGTHIWMSQVTRQTTFTPVCVTPNVLLCIDAPKVIGTKRVRLKNNTRLTNVCWGRWLDIFVAGYDI